MWPTSFSQNGMFEKCHFGWYCKYVKKIPVVSDMSYAYAGNVLHKTLQTHYEGGFVSTEEMKEFFNKLWEKKGLHTGILKLKKDNYLLMAINGINLNVSNTSTEMKIFFPDVVGYLDVVDTKNDVIVDWKSSTRHETNEEEYIKQLKFYTFLYYRKFNRLPKKAIVYFLKYGGSKMEMSMTPTMDDVKEMEEWHNNIRKEMDEILLNGKSPKHDNCKDPYCAFHNLSSNEGGIAKFTLHFLGNYIQVDGPISDLLHKGLAKKFSYELKNAHWMKKSNPYARTTVEFWNKRKRMLPIGMYSGLIKTLKDYAKHKKLELAIDIDDQRQYNDSVITMPLQFVNGKKLRDYQIEAADEFLRHKIGILEIGTGGGKTECYTEIIRRLGYKSLIIVDKIELLRQTKKRIEDNLGIDVGTIGGSQEDIKHITVATVQTLTKNLRKYRDYLASVRFAIFDECHHVSSRSYFRLSHYLINTEYRLGGSGTAYRDDGNDMMINATTGYKVFDLGSKTLIERGWLVKPTIIFIKGFIDKEQVKEIEDRTKIGLINETPNYNNFYKAFISELQPRNNLIEDIVLKNRGKKILILTKLVAHGQYLENAIDNSRHLYGVTNKEERKKLLNRFVNGDVDVLISTISIFAEGIDIPQLEIVINAGANRGNVKTIQILGRILRKLEGKKGATYYDFMDESRF